MPYPPRWDAELFLDVFEVVVLLAGIRLLLRGIWNF